MKKEKPLLIFGSAEIASLARYYFENDSNYRVVAFTVDDDCVNAESFEGLPLVPFSRVSEIYPPDKHEMFVGLSYARLNQLREEKYRQAKESGYRLASYVCSKAATWPDLTIGDNCFILENQTIQPTVRIGDDVMIWSGNHIGHGSEIGDHTYIASHVVISGHCRIGRRCFLGVNATVRDFRTIGDDCFIAMDASVTHNVEAGSVVVGEPGKIFAPDDRRSRVLKKTYFQL
jgi:sugar O-acyltransferase (sialic acid O-acetyltransferase NeuD family)